MKTRGGFEFNVSFQGASTIADVIARIELASRTDSANAATRTVEVRIGSESDRLVLRDLSTGTDTFSTASLDAVGRPSAEPYIGLGLVVATAMATATSTANPWSTTWACWRWLSLA